ncbi:uncharacterized protein K441DRAFT_663038, partial [Cenococcum geophilum 1.58]|uniref:uncharacterized protein n=1 Tax=Cenococcum geophilum 1.58 TaxID=794803 RepID=UPI00358EC858
PPVSHLVERHGAVEAGLCFRCLELCPCFHLVKPSGRRRVAVALLSRRRVAVFQVARTTPIKTLF